MIGSIKVDVLLITMVLTACINGWVVRSGRSANIIVVWLARLVCAAMMFIASYFSFRSDFLTITGTQIVASFGLAAIFGIVAVFINCHRKLTEKDKLLYAYLFSFPPAKGYVIVETVVWVIYLLPYEFIMRGLLLPFSMDSLLPYQVILLNASFYALVHIQQGTREAVGAFLLGCILCLITIYTGSFWGAFAIHLALALSNSYFIWWLLELKVVLSDN